MYMYTQATRVAVGAGAREIRSVASGDDVTTVDSVVEARIRVAAVILITLRHCKWRLK